MPENVAEMRGVSRRFGAALALDRVSLDVTPGCVHGLVGANGAGKTTLIKHLMGLLRAKQGTVRVFGMDPVRHPVQVLRRVGYLSEERDLPEWMRIGELMRYTRAYHPHWDQDYAQELIETFGLDPAKKVKALSKGMRAQTGLIAAVAHRPDLLVLDEPSTGLDAVVRRDILNAVIRTVADEGRAAIFSSHLLDEVEQMSDHVTLIHEGQVVLAGQLDDVKEEHHVLQIRFDTAWDTAPALAGVLSLEGRGRAWTAVCNGGLGQVRAGLRDLGGEVIQSRHASLQEIFVARVGRKHLPAGAE